MQSRYYFPNEKYNKSAIKINGLNEKAIKEIIVFTPYILKMISIGLLIS